MFISQTRLPHLLPPGAYFEPGSFQEEKNSLLEPAWHPVATTNEVKNNGDFVTRELFGHSVQIRNFDGELRALSNICAHRHCVITSERCGNSPTMKCQYHGWEYGEDGKTRKIPEPKNFTPFPENGERVPVYRVEKCGQLVFVCLNQNTPDLESFLGEYFGVISEKFGSQMKEFLRLDVDCSANWKVAVENTLEAYHVPCVHENTFREDPGEEQSTHILNQNSTAFGTDLPFSPHSRLDAFFQRSESGVVKLLGIRPAGKYWHHHLFPNLLLSFTDAISLMHCVIPTGPTTAVAIIRQFGTMGNSKWGPKRWIANFWGKLKGNITKQIMMEDVQLIPHIQAGLEKSNQAGVLGRCEERIHAFQSYVMEKSTKYDSERDGEEQGGKSSSPNSPDHPVMREVEKTS